MNIRKVRPMFNQVITTMVKYGDDELNNGLIDYKKVQNPVKEYQTVVAVGPMVRNVQVGDLVIINPKRYSKMKHQEGSLKDGVIGDNMVISYNFNTLELDHVPHLLITDQDIDFVIEEYEEEYENQTDIIMPNTDILIP